MRQASKVKTSFPRSRVPSHDGDGKGGSRVSETIVQNMGRLQHNNSRQIPSQGRSPRHSHSSVGMRGVIDRLWDSVACHSKLNSVDAITPSAHHQLRANSKALDRHETPNTVIATEEDDGIESMQAVEQNNDVIFENLDQMQHQRASSLLRAPPSLQHSVAAPMPMPMPMLNAAVCSPPVPLQSSTIMMPMSAVMSQPVSLSQAQSFISPSGSNSLTSISNHQQFSLPNTNQIGTSLLSLQQQQMQLQQQIQLLEQQLQLLQQQQLSLTTGDSFLNSSTNSFRASTFGSNINNNVSQYDNFNNSNNNIAITPNLSPASLNMPPLPIPRPASNPSLLSFSPSLPILNNASILTSFHSADSMLALALAGSLTAQTPTSSNLVTIGIGSLTGVIRGNFDGGDNMLSSQQQQLHQQNQILADEAAVLECYAQDHGRKKKRVEPTTLPSQPATSCDNNRINVSRNNSNSVLGGYGQSVSHSVVDRIDDRIMDNLGDYDLSEVEMNGQIEESEVYQHLPQQQHHSSPPPYHSVASAIEKVSSNNLSSTRSTSNNISSINANHASTSNNEGLDRKLSKEESEFEAAIIASLHLETTRLQQELTDSHAMQKALRDSIGTAGHAESDNCNSQTSAPIPSSFLPPSYENVISLLPPSQHRLGVSQYAHSTSSNMKANNYDSLPPSYETVVQRPQQRANEHPTHKSSHRRTHSYNSVYKSTTYQQSPFSGNEKIFQQDHSSKNDLHNSRPIQSYHRRTQSDNAILSSAQLQQLHEPLPPPPPYHQTLLPTYSERMDEMIRQAERDAPNRLEQRQHRIAPTSGRSSHSTQKQHHHSQHAYFHHDVREPLTPKFTDTYPGKCYTGMSECSIYGGSESSMSSPVPISTEVKSGYASRSSTQQSFPSSSNGNIVGHGILSTGGHPSGSSKNNRVRFDVDEVEVYSPPNHSDNASPHCHKIQTSFKEIKKSAESAVSHASLPW